MRGDDRAACRPWRILEALAKGGPVGPRVVGGPAGAGLWRGVLPGVLDRGAALPSFAGVTVVAGWYIGGSGTGPALALSGDPVRQGGVLASRQT